MGTSAASRRPLGIAVVGGLAFSQIVTLYVTPVFYTYFDELQAWLGRRAVRGAGRARAVRCRWLATDRGEAGATLYCEYAETRRKRTETTRATSRIFATPLGIRATPASRSFDRRSWNELPSLRFTGLLASVGSRASFIAAILSS